jgi:hypothetical protein
MNKKRYHLWDQDWSSDPEKDKSYIPCFLILFAALDILAILSAVGYISIGF